MILQDLKDQLKALDKGSLAVWVRDGKVVDPMRVVVCRLAEMFEENWEGEIVLSEKGQEVRGHEYDIAEFVPLVAAYLFGEDTE